MAALLTLCMPTVLGVFKPENIFFFFSIMMVLQLFFVKWLMSEAKGRLLEALSDALSK